MKKSVAYLGVFLALAMILSYVEAILPFAIGIPGVKLGLANLVTVLMLYLIGWREALCVSVLRIVLTGILFGNLVSICYGLAGGLLSFVLMFILIRINRFHVVTVSICGGIIHNMGQLIVAGFLVSSYYVIYYMPVLLIAGFVTGALIGIVARTMLFNINTLEWDEEILEELNIPCSMLPEPKPSSCVYGMADPSFLGGAIPRIKNSRLVQLLMDGFWRL